MNQYVERAIKYATDIIDGTKPACEEKILEAKRFMRDIDNPAYYLNEPVINMAVKFIENVYCALSR